MAANWPQPYRGYHATGRQAEEKPQGSDRRRSVQAIIDASPERLKPGGMFLVTGMRLDELRTLQFTDVDFGAVA